MRFPCGGYAPGPVTNMRAGQTVNVRFYASGMKAKDIRSQPKPTSPNRQFSQARHGGGMVSFIFCLPYCFALLIFYFWGLLCCLLCFVRPGLLICSSGCGVKWIV